MPREDRAGFLAEKITMEISRNSDSPPDALHFPSGLYTLPFLSFPLDFLFLSQEAFENIPRMFPPCLLVFFIVFWIFFFLDFAFLVFFFVLLLLLFCLVFARDLTTNCLCSFISVAP